MISQSATRPRGGDVFLDAFAAGLRPDDPMTVLEWADKHRVLAGGSSAEPGPYRSDRTPYMREILEALSPSSPVEEIVFVAAAQVGKTEAGLNWIGHVIDVAPGPMLIVLPTLDLAEDFSDRRIRSMLDACPRLAAKMGGARSRDTTDRALRKTFRGGSLKLAGANSAASLRSVPVRYLYVDEEDEFPMGVKGQGNPIDLARARTRTFGPRAKKYRTSTPTVEGISSIDAGYKAGDRRLYHVPCPECGEFQALEFPNLKWEENQPETVRYACRACGVLIGEEHKGAMLEAGRWVATATSTDPGLRSYHLNGLYSPPGWLSWVAVVREFLACKGNPEKLRAFTNTVLAETWKEKGEAPEWERLYMRREAYKQGTVPRRGLFLTAGVDVQADRLECEVKAWGRERENWSVDYLIIPGDPSTPAPWAELNRRLSSSWPHETGNALALQRVAIDSGYLAEEVAKFVRRFPSERWMAVRGDVRTPMILGVAKVVDVNTKGKRTRRGLMQWPIGVHHAKAELYGWLRTPPPLGASPYPPGFAHFPADYDESYFRQLVSEELVTTRTRTGYAVREWRKLPGRVNPGGRNEVLDCTVYARAAAAACGMDRFLEEHWRAFEIALGMDSTANTPQAGETGATPAVTLAADQAPAGPTSPRGRQPKRGGGGYMSRWRKG